MITQNIHNVDKVKISVKSYKGSSWLEIAHYDADGNIMLELAVFGNDGAMPSIEMVEQA